MCCSVYICSLQFLFFFKREPAWQPGHEDKCVGSTCIPAHLVLQTDCKVFYSHLENLRKKCIWKKTHFYLHLHEISFETRICTFAKKRANSIQFSFGEQIGLFVKESSFYILDLYFPNKSSFTFQSSFCILVFVNKETKSICKHSRKKKQSILMKKGLIL